MINENTMKCALCRQGSTSPGLVTVLLQRGETTVIVKQVPAEICENCSEYYLTQEVTENLLVRAEAAVKNGAEVDILRYAA
jgi:YgiT-type zinc finger domain-containing protein